MSQTPVHLGHLFLAFPSFDALRDRGDGQKLGDDNTDHCWDNPRADDPVSPRPRWFAWYKFTMFITRTTWNWKMYHRPDTEKYCSETTPQDVARSPSTVGRMPAMYQLLFCRHVQYIESYLGMSHGQCRSKIRIGA